MSVKLWEAVDRKVVLSETLRLVKTHANGDKTAKVYKDEEWDEYRVKHFTGGQHHADADYHTDDLEDAHGTAQNFVGKANEDHETVGYQPDPDPQMRAQEPNAAARFVAKHNAANPDGRVTDVDDSTLDDKLFKASNMKRAVPDGKDTHGHTPTGKDAAVYESRTLRDIFGSSTTE